MRLSLASPGNDRFSVKKLQVKRFLQILGSFRSCLSPTPQKKPRGTNMFFFAVLPPSDPLFHVFYLNNALQSPKLPKLIEL